VKGASRRAMDGTGAEEEQHSLGELGAVVTPWYRPQMFAVARGVQMLPLTCRNRSSLFAVARVPNTRSSL